MKSTIVNKTNEITVHDYQEGEIPPYRAGDEVVFSSHGDSSGTTQRPRITIHIRKGPEWKNRERYVYSADGTKRGPKHAPMKHGRFWKLRRR